TRSPRTNCDGSGMPRRGRLERSNRRVCDGLGASLPVPGFEHSDARWSSMDTVRSMSPNRGAWQMQSIAQKDDLNAMKCDVSTCGSLALPAQRNPRADSGRGERRGGTPPCGRCSPLSGRSMTSARLLWHHEPIEGLQAKRVSDSQLRRKETGGDLCR